MKSMMACLQKSSKLFRKKMYSCGLLALNSAGKITSTKQMAKVEKAELNRDTIITS